ncbi:Aste57867_3661 [Aphanomyces stellatus]|uniref:Aste57867_3661 protein n=1 Tax=Aphanomyces stellatus TaxID=120398 RepID=A0A485KFK9_9STRA|nr:hypothetical protein As57867_003650 [Aphanomyces stellatus]VFT80816.1 Aste57867_3661 [Aphanomyces stellatus]
MAARSQRLARLLEPHLVGSPMHVPSHFASKTDYVHQLIHNYYLPVFYWAEAQHAALPSSKSCLVLGLSCVQGGGKTTMSSYIQQLFQEAGKSCATLSLDDVYLTRADQLKVTAAHPHNPLLEHRGNPGTHDIDLLMSIIDDATAGRDVLVPRYDKSAFDGRGDRFPRDQWLPHRGPLDVLLVEGWCLGFEALDSNVDGDLGLVNHALRDFDCLYAALSALIVVKVADVAWVYTWREEAEARMREAGKPAMTPTQVRDFVDRFMPAYRAYLPTLYADATTGTHLSTIPRLVVEIGQHRDCLAVMPRHRRDL